MTADPGGGSGAGHGGGARDRAVPSCRMACCKPERLSVTRTSFVTEGQEQSDVDYSRAAALTLITEYATAANDTGSPEVQVALAFRTHHHA